MSSKDTLNKIQQIVVDTESFIKNTYDNSTLEEPIMNDVILTKVNMAYHNIANIIKSQMEEE